MFEQQGALRLPLPSHSFADEWLDFGLFVYCLFICMQRYSSFKKLQIRGGTVQGWAWADTTIVTFLQTFIVNVEHSHSLVVIIYCRARNKNSSLWRNRWFLRQRQKTSRWKEDTTNFLRSSPPPSPTPFLSLCSGFFWNFIYSCTGRRALESLSSRTYALFSTPPILRLQVSEEATHTEKGSWKSLSVGGDLKYVGSWEY